MDPRHKLYKTLDTLAIEPDPNETMSARTDAEATNVQAMSGVTMEGLKKKLEEGLGATYVEIEDLSGMSQFSIQSKTWGSVGKTPEGHLSHTSALTLRLGGCGQMYEAIIVSPQFAKKTTLARHRLVNSTLKQEIAAIHAWTPKCHTPEEWEKKKPQ